MAIIMYADVKIYYLEEFRETSLQLIGVFGGEKKHIKEGWTILLEKVESKKESIFKSAIIKPFYEDDFPKDLFKTGTEFELYKFKKVAIGTIVRVVNT